MATVTTKWEVLTYDVWSSEDDGDFANNSFVQDRDYEIVCTVTTYNQGTQQEFDAATPTDEQIRKALGIRAGVEIETEGDDLCIYVNDACDYFPLGELRCVSHKSLSPLRK